MPAKSGGSEKKKTHKTVGFVRVHNNKLKIRPIYFITSERPSA